jgi:Domain of unknown function (DUF4145)
MAPYTSPALELSAFNCPHCEAFANQGWGNPQAVINGAVQGMPFRVAVCSHCVGYSIWTPEKMVYPAQTTAPLPNPDLPDPALGDYLEARQVLPTSPRAAAALLRLAIQRLMPALGQGGGNLNSDIGALVKQGLPATIQKALDIVRVVGNNAVHPGEINLDDNVETANRLFGLINLIVDNRITQPRQVGEMFGELPAGAIEAIEKRDGGP